MSCIYFRSAVATLALLIGINGAGFHAPFSASAASPLHRIALQLNGSLCGSQHVAITSVLSRVPGVQAVDLSSVPDHVLVDIDSRLIRAHDVLAIITQAVPSTVCRAEPMQSCIAAGMAMTAASPTGRPDRSP